MSVNKNVVILTIEGAALLIEKNTKETRGALINLEKGLVTHEPPTFVDDYVISEFTMKNNINVGIGSTLDRAFDELPRRLKKHISIEDFFATREALS